MINKHDASKQSVDPFASTRTGYDPLQAARDQSGSVNKNWLKNGELMSPIQRVGNSIVSLAFILSGAFTASVFWEDFSSRDATCLFWGFATLFFVGLGCLGLGNALRLKRARG